MDGWETTFHFGPFFSPLSRRIVAGQRIDHLRLGPSRGVLLAPCRPDVPGTFRRAGDGGGLGEQLGRLFLAERRLLLPGSFASGERASSVLPLRLVLLRRPGRLHLLRAGRRPLRHPPHEAHQEPDHPPGPFLHEQQPQASAGWEEGSGRSDDTSASCLAQHGRSIFFPRHDGSRRGPPAHPTSKAGLKEKKKTFCLIAGNFPW